MSQAIFSTIKLVASVSRIVKDFPEDANRAFHGAVASCTYPVDRSRLNGKLAIFLADHIGTTRFDDDASRLSIFTGRTVADDMIRRGVSGHFKGTLMAVHEISPRHGSLEAHAKALEAQAEALLRKADTIRSHAAAHGQHEEPHIESYQWPVFTEKYEDAADYINQCSGHIRSLGIPFDVGLERATPPDSLLRTINVDGVGSPFGRFNAWRSSLSSAVAVSVFS